MPTIPTPPADLSGGFMIIQADNGTDRHKHRIHVLAFDTASFVVGGVAGVGDDGNHNYAYTGSRPAGSELGINDTFAAYTALIKPLYNAVWTLSLVALYQMQAGEPVEIWPTPTPASVVGTSPDGPPTGPERAVEVIYNMRTNAGRKGKVIAIGGSASFILYAPVIVTPTTGGSANDRALMAYLSGANTAIVGHDNQKFQGRAHQTWTVNRRLRRHYGYA